MKKGQTLGGITTRVILELDKVLKEVILDIVLVHGDAITTFIGALTTFYNQIRIGHVEAELRIYNKYSPYPEEMNRQVNFCMANLNFAPTELSKNNLVK